MRPCYCMFIWKDCCSFPAWVSAEIVLPFMSSLHICFWALRQLQIRKHKVGLIGQLSDRASQKNSSLAQSLCALWLAPQLETWLHPAKQMAHEEQEESAGRTAGNIEGKHLESCPACFSIILNLTLTLLFTAVEFSTMLITVRNIWHRNNRKKLFLRYYFFSTQKNCIAEVKKKKRQICSS